ncbi:type II toxin-antitoxin system death-on-curing family toxin [bacterium AH-315-E10]|nr:type II toxin-antitoxin system death-on-curing family toxin [bacterium AH-315-E10]
MNPVFLSIDNVLAMHEDTIEQEGGMSGIRDIALLESAVMMPQQQFGGDYLHPDLPSMASAYLFHLVKNHPFLDGNKRVSAMSAFVFLDVNGYDLTASPDAFEKTVIDVASGEMSKEMLTTWFHEHAAEKNQ